MKIKMLNLKAMYSNNNGSILVTTLIVFSVLITISMTCIGLYFSNSSILNLEYKEAVMEQYGYGAIEICHSNIVEEVKTAIENINNKDKFNDYFLGNKFSTSISDISNCNLSNVKISIHGKVQIDNEDKLIKFDIVSTVKENVYIKKYKASVKIKNPYLTTNLSEENNKEKENNEFEAINKIQLDINEIVKIYNYKEL